MPQAIPQAVPITATVTSASGVSVSYWVIRRVDIDLRNSILTAVVDGYASASTQQAGNTPVTPGISIQIPSTDPNYNAVLTGAGGILSQLSAVAGSYLPAAP